MRAKQILYFFTRPIAKLIYLFDRERCETLRERKNILSLMNYKSYIKTTSEILYEQNLPFIALYGGSVNLLKLNCEIEAERMFAQKKKHGDFDSLNLLLK